jgi:hypothetical protein
MLRNSSGLKFKEINLHSLYVHRCSQGERGCGHLLHPLNFFKKLGHKNAIKHKNRDPPYIFSQPEVPPPLKKNLQKKLKDPPTYLEF